jgi:hypothetical protein
MEFKGVHSYYNIPSPPIGLAGIVIEPTDDLHRLQNALIDAVSPFTVISGTSAAFYSTEGGRDIQPFLLEYVGHFVTIAAGEKLAMLYFPYRATRCRIWGRAG